MGGDRAAEPVAERGPQDSLGVQGVQLGEDPGEHLRPRPVGATGGWPPAAPASLKNPNRSTPTPCTIRS